MLLSVLLEDCDCHLHGGIHLCRGPVWARPRHGHHETCCGSVLSNVTSYLESYKVTLL